MRGGFRREREVQNQAGMGSSKSGGIGISANPEDIVYVAFRREVLVSNKESTTASSWQNYRTTDHQ